MYFLKYTNGTFLRRTQLVALGAFGSFKKEIGAESKAIVAVDDGFIIRLVFGESRYEKAANAIPARHTPAITNLEL